MNESVNWRDVKYNNTFEQEILALQKRRDHDPNFTVDDLEGVLDDLYIMSGSDLGEIMNLSLAAAIAAYEHFIAQWKAERSN